MGLPDRHDDRTFRHFAKLDHDGNVVASVEVAEGAPAPVGGPFIYIDVTDAYPYDFTDVVIPVFEQQDIVVRRPVENEEVAPAPPPPVPRDPDTIRAELLAANRVSRG